MNTLGLNLFGGGATIYKYIGPQLDIETQVFTSNILIQAIPIIIDTGVLSIEITTQAYTITFTQEGNDVIIGT